MMGVIDQLRKKSCQPLLCRAMTEEEGDPHRKRLEEAGFDELLVKPFDPTEVVKLLVQRLPRSPKGTG
jgi:DNA-binding response OmpR family regulator